MGADGHEAWACQGIPEQGDADPDRGRLLHRVPRSYIYPDQKHVRVRRPTIGWNHSECVPKGAVVVERGGGGAAVSTLTPRQLQVLLLRADGIAPPEIADALGIDVETVHSHMKRALKRLDARDAANAMLLIGRMGLLGEVSR